MARAPRKTAPRWAKVAEEECGDLVELYRKNLRRITSRLASHEHADTIDRRHVIQAHESMVRSGLDRLPWWKRPQLKMSIAGCLVGLAFAVPDCVPILVTNSTGQLWASRTLMTVLLVAALFAYVWSWVQNRL
ncbi:hypothetical protein Mal4_04470 [Maioricimonas rarisocia]|uniref:Uncharacterized protein n=1 Tax=Maioricimonas rarisocia TaxID=2528026 RepID=A0A517Z112_9PLAN|nr:hypothetical protein [Maioricimonas rarisocia]QDU36164.1 hypothetical protein Mal4_04470 [Maioricimonas rarisocia]